LPAPSVIAIGQVRRLCENLQITPHAAMCSATC
jgi:hypothetical protein